jgi:hypothetical protein
MGGNYYNKFGEKLYMGPFFSAASRRSFREFVLQRKAVLRECWPMDYFCGQCESLQLHKMHSQCHYLLDIDGTMNVNVLRYETLDAEISSCIGKTVSLPLLNSARDKDVPWRSFYDEEIAARVYSYYAKDFIRLGYEKDSWRTRLEENACYI